MPDEQTPIGPWRRDVRSTRKYPACDDGGWPNATDSGVLSAEEALERRRAVVLAGHRGDRETCRAHLDDPDPGVRQTALTATARAQALQAGDLRRGLVDADPGVRRRTAQLIADSSASPPAADVSLLGLLADADDTVIEVAAWASGERQPTEPGAVAKLSEIARDHPDALCREAAVAALGAIGDPEGLAAILAGTSDKAAVRRRAVIALAPFDGPEVTAALEKATEDRDWQVRQSAEDLL